MKNGYYYVKYQGEWVIFLLCGEDWWEPSSVVEKSSHEFEQIGPRIPMPDEPFEAHCKFAIDLGSMSEDEL